MTKKSYKNILTISQNQIEFMLVVVAISLCNNTVTSSPSFKPDTFSHIDFWLFSRIDPRTSLI